MFKEKLGICPYGELSEKIFQVSNEKSIKDLIEESDNELYNESIEEIGKISNKKSTKKLTKELIKESDNESNKKLAEK